MQKRHDQDEILGITQRDSGLWFVTWDGRVPGDSRSFINEHLALAEARALVAADPEYRQLDA